MSELRKVLTKPIDIKEDTLQKTERENRYSGKKVLLVEDNELNREIATALLEGIGILVDSVEDGTDAVERMNEVDADRYDLIFMDIQMPKMDGYMTTREIRTLKNNKKANIPIVAMTANAFEELNNLHKEGHFLFLSIRNNAIMCLENKKIKWKEANYEH